MPVENAASAARAKAQARAVVSPKHPDLEYGPERPKGETHYPLYTTPNYLTGHARKIMLDLIRKARMYDGRVVRIYVVSDRSRCTTCTNLTTGERVLSDCPVCHGTGYAEGWEYVGRFWTYTDFGPRYELGTPLGNTENPNGTKQAIVIVGAPVLHDQALIVFEEGREVFKIYDIEPHIVAMRGTVITQIANSSRVTPGSPEYLLLDRKEEETDDAQA